MQYFENVRHNLAALDAFTKLVKGMDTLKYKMPSLPDTLQVLLTNVVNAWSMAMESMLLGLPDIT